MYLTGLILCRPAPEIFQTTLVMQNRAQAMPTGSIAIKLETEIDATMLALRKDHEATTFAHQYRNK
jgi:hypothetical protein